MQKQNSNSIILTANISRKKYTRKMKEEKIAIKKILRLVKKNKIKECRINRSVKRILEIKQKYNISDTEKIEKIDIEETNKKINEIRNNTK